MKSTTATVGSPGPHNKACNHAVCWFGAPVADAGVAPRTHSNYLAEHRGCPGSSVSDAEGGVVQIMGAPGEPG